VFLSSVPWPYRQEDYAVKKNTDTDSGGLVACEEGVDPIEDRLRANTRTTIEAVFFEALDSFLCRLRYSRDWAEL